MSSEAEGESAVERAFADYLGALADQAEALRVEARATLERGARQARDLGWSQRRIARALGRSQPEVKRLLDRSGAPGSALGVDGASPAGSVLDDVLRVHRDDIVAAAARHGARRVRVFGSVAAGTHRGDSDVDLLVDLDDGVGLFALGALEVELEALLGRPVDVVSEMALRPAVRESVHAIAL
ncbi:nucleotidyltransferase domain-containing protein [Isoptericola sp. NPDC056134]|uniref:nucleotidyltransferase domain-containing protein n=1 Tax=Isoptericola sp. NPDC056134 TaxID=3345723 RepID=UPI0035EB09DD